MSVRPLLDVMKRVASAMFAVMSIEMGSAAHAEDVAPTAPPQLTLNFRADPDTEFKLVSITRNGGKIALSEASGTGVHIDLAPPLPEALWLVVKWKEGDQFSAYPILLVHSLAGLKTDMLVVKDPVSKPSNQQIRTLCGDTDVKDVDHAFRMYFTCKAAAAERSPSQTKRAALQGWLKSNLYLVKAIRPVSPFTYDSDLENQLRDVIQAVEKDGNPKSWHPLRIDDARDFLKASEARDVSLYPLVAALKDGGNLDAAMAVLDYIITAYDGIVGRDGTRPIDRIDRNLLVQTRHYLEGLMQAARPVPSPLRRQPTDNGNVIQNSHAPEWATR